MKKKGLAVLVLSLALSAGCGMAAMAATGWVSENGKWVYYDSSGGHVTNEWKKGADNKWRYLDGYGEMAVNSWVEDKYYVDSNGIMINNQWLQLGTSINGATDETHWYYFTESGKAVMDAWKKINSKWYHFDSEGIMETGWIEDNMYFAGDDGAALIGWHKLDPPDGQDDDVDPFDELEGKKWYYFNSSGKKYVPDSNTVNGYVEKRIDGTYYCFDSNGAMQTGWVDLAGSGRDDISGYRFYGKDGKAVTGWYSAEPPEGVSGYENDVEWFYFGKNGVPKTGPQEGEATTSDFISINNKKYLFNPLGVPVYGLQRVYTSRSKNDYTAFYFDENSRTSQKGKMTIEEEDGTKSTFYFQDTGKGYTGVKDNSLYYMGKLQKADEGTKYEVIHIPGGSSYVVNTSGKISKNSAGVKDADGTKYSTNSSGVLTKIDGVSVSGSDYGREANEPIWKH